MIDLKTFDHLVDIELGAPQAKATSVEGNQAEAEKVLWTSDDGTIEVGVWECSPGRFTSRRDDFSEICHIVSGSITLKSEGQPGRAIGVGELLILPTGWRGEWTIHETTRKLYVVYKAGAR